LNLAETIRTTASNGHDITAQELNSYLQRLKRIQDTSTGEKSGLTAEIREYVLGSNDVFHSRDVSEHLNLNREDKKKLSVVLKRLESEGLIAAWGGKRGYWRVVDQIADEINWWDADANNTYDLKWPFALQNLVSLYKKNLAIIAGDTNQGKGHPHGTPILTPTGWKNIEELKTGEHVYSADGSLTEITGVFPRGLQQTFEVEFNDYTSVVCDWEHLWTVKRQKRGGVRPAWETLPTHVIYSQYFLNQRPHKGKYTIPSCDPIKFPQKEVPLDPYVLGILLGDGCLCQGTPVVTSNDTEIIEILKQHNKVSDIKSPGRTPSYGLLGMTAVIRELGLEKCRSWEKFIPPDYLFNSPENRLALLQGLMDTDGDISRNGKALSFSTTSPQLSKDVAFLVRSLGGRVTFGKVRRTHYRQNGEYKRGRNSYRLHIYMNNLSPFRLTRKQKLLRPFAKGCKKTMVSIKNQGVQPTICISVAHPSGLYITKDFIVTHNTAFLLNLAIMNADKHPIDYFTNELGPEELKRRLLYFQEMGIPTESFRQITFKSRSSDYIDVINPDKLTIVDYLMVTKEAYLIGDDLDAIHNKLKNGIAVIAIQKKMGEVLGRGKDFAVERPRLYLTMGGNRFKIIKGKNWAKPGLNPNGKFIDFKLWNGCKFVPQGGWQGGVPRRQEEETFHERHIHADM